MLKLKKKKKISNLASIIDKKNPFILTNKLWYIIQSGEKIGRKKFIRLTDIQLEAWKEMTEAYFNKNRSRAFETWLIEYFPTYFERYLHSRSLHNHARGISFFLWIQFYTGIRLENNSINRSTIDMTDLMHDQEFENGFINNFVEKYHPYLNLIDKDTGEVIDYKNFNEPRYNEDISCDKSSMYSSIYILYKCLDENLSVSYKDYNAAVSNKWFPLAKTVNFQRMADLHNDIMFFLVFLTIFIFVFLVMTAVLYTVDTLKLNKLNLQDKNVLEYIEENNDGYSSRVSRGTLLEIIWTLIPMAILVSIAIPSLSLLYENNSVPKHPNMTVHVTGNQWYWNYAYRCLQVWRYDPKSYENHQDLKEQLILLNKVNFDSYMITDADLTNNHIRLMSVDMPLYLPARCIVKLLITSYDVIHSFAIPKFGLKTDAVPGRLNQTFIHVDFLGSVYGQCSELCGIHHAFMPIEIRAVEKELFLKHIIPSYYKKLNKEAFLADLSEKQLDILAEASWKNFVENEEQTFIITYVLDSISTILSKPVASTSKVDYILRSLDFLILNNSLGFIEDRELSPKEQEMLKKGTIDELFPEYFPKVKADKEIINESTIESFAEDIMASRPHLFTPELKAYFNGIDPRTLPLKQCSYQETMATRRNNSKITETPIKSEVVTTAEELRRMRRDAYLIERALQNPDQCFLYWDEETKRMEIYPNKDQYWYLVKKRTADWIRKNDWVRKND